MIRVLDLLFSGVEGESSARLRISRLQSTSSGLRKHFQSWEAAAYFCRFAGNVLL